MFGISGELKVLKVHVVAASTVAIAREYEELITDARSRVVAEWRVWVPITLVPITFRVRRRRSVRRVAVKAGRFLIVILVRRGPPRSRCELSRRGVPRRTASRGPGKPRAGTACSMRAACVRWDGAPRCDQ